MSVYGKRLGYLTYFVGDAASLVGRTKYKHTVEVRGTFLYNEHILPGLFYGKPVMVVEGVFDALSTIQAGIPTVAATTNELTKYRLLKLYRYTNKIQFWMDSDKAGQDGMDRTIKEIKKLKLPIQYRIFDEHRYKDANEFLQGNPEEFSERMKTLKKELEEWI